MVKKITIINPVARAMAVNRRRALVVPPKKGKGSYNRKKDKTDAKQQQFKFPEDQG
jgi:stalled ribosome alternative rescue factor ArfA